MHLPKASDTVFITGGGSGIGAGLAKAFHARGAKVIIGGRNVAALRAVANECPGMEICVLDVSDFDAVAACAQRLGTLYPHLNCVVNNAGVQRLLDFGGEVGLSRAQLDEEIAINLQGLVYVTEAFLPLLRRQPAARLVQVSSGLAFVPLVRAPLYSATKAAVRAFTRSLRVQLRGSSVRVIELIPPVVATALHRNQPVIPPGAMPLDRFTAKAMRALDSGRDELPIGLAAVLRAAARVAPGFFLKVINKNVR